MKKGSERYAHTHYKEQEAKRLNLNQPPQPLWKIEELDILQYCVPICIENASKYQYGGYYEYIGT